MNFFKIPLVLFLGGYLSAFAQPVEIVPAEFRGAIQPQAAIAPDGKVFVTFGREKTIYCAKSTDGAARFLTPVKVAGLSKLALGMRRGPRIAVSGTNVVITAVSNDEGNLFAWNSNDGIAWSKAVRINSIEHSAREGLHGFAGDDRGKFFTVWLDLRNGGAEIWGARSRDGGKTWSKDTLIYHSPDGHVCECCHPSVAMSDDERIAVMWRNSINGARDMFISKSADGGKTFDAARKLGEGTWKLNACPMDGGSLIFDEHNSIHSIWRRDDSVFTSSTGKEIFLGTGRQPVMASWRGKSFYVWQDGSRLLKQIGDGKPKILADDGAYQSIASRQNFSPIVFWEGSTNGLRTIFTSKLAD